MTESGVDEHLDRTFFALADRTRRRMLARLAEGEATVSELAAPHNMSLPGVLKHLGILREAGLIRDEKDGRVRRCQLDAEALARASGWIEHYRQFWSAQLDNLEAYLKFLDGTAPADIKKKVKTKATRKKQRQKPSS